MVLVARSICVTVPSIDFDTILPDVIDLYSCLIGALYGVMGYDVCAFLQPVKGVYAADSRLVRTRFDTMHNGLVDKLDRMLAAVLRFHDHGLGSRIQVDNGPVNSSNGVLCGAHQSTQEEERLRYANRVLLFQFQSP
jgi:hypothetical protein